MSTIRVKGVKNIEYETVELSAKDLGTTLEDIVSKRISKRMGGFSKLKKDLGSDNIGFILRGKKIFAYADGYDDPEDLIEASDSPEDVVLLHAAGILKNDKFTM